MAAWSSVVLKIVRDDLPCKTALCKRSLFQEKLPATDHVTMDELTPGKPVLVIEHVRVVGDPTKPTTVLVAADMLG